MLYQLFYKAKQVFCKGKCYLPCFFSICVNDFEMGFVTKNNVPQQSFKLNLFLLMYAEDMGIFAESAEELQDMLNIYYIYYNIIYSYTTK